MGVAERRERERDSVCVSHCLTLSHFVFVCVSFRTIMICAVENVDPTRIVNILVQTASLRTRPSGAVFKFERPVPVAYPVQCSLVQSRW